MTIHFSLSDAHSHKPDPSLHAQKVATRPHAHIWLQASAGSGKTKVLVDRILRLLVSGESPHSILCVTFTTAAAHEMHERVLQQLQHWMLCSDTDLDHALQNLLETHSIPPSVRARARQLYHETLQLSDGLAIQTIHSFCQTILAKFPLEAGLTPGFQVGEPHQLEALYETAFSEGLQALQETASDLLEFITEHFKSHTLYSTLKTLWEQRGRWLQVHHHFPTIQDYAQQLSRLLEIPHTSDIFQSAEAQNLTFCHIPLMIQEALQEAQRQKPHSILEQWLIATPQKRVQMLPDYQSLFLTQTGTPLKRPKVDCDLACEHLMRFLDLKNRVTLTGKSVALYAVARLVYTHMQHLKSHLLDFNDLIASTQNLLDQPAAVAWVFHHLDYHIRHILVDEAQDTNSEQWQIILSLIQEFISQEGRSVFIVGDAKQSIYQFQGANVHGFLRTRNHLSEQLHDVHQPFHCLTLEKSFRSTPHILAFVDRVFASGGGYTQLGLAEGHIIHHAHRQDVGTVGCLPFVSSTAINQSADQKKDDEPQYPWALPPQAPNTSADLEQDVAKKLTQFIQHLLKDPTPLAATGERAQPDDILILVRQRGPLISVLQQTLQQSRIPVHSVEQKLLQEDIITQDIQALIRFCLNPGDDLSLACVLRSPLCSVPDSLLEDIAVHRTASLWEALQSHPSETAKTQTAFLRELLKKSDYLTPMPWLIDIFYTLDGQKKYSSFHGETVISTIQHLILSAQTAAKTHLPTLTHFLEYLQDTPIQVTTPHLKGYIRIMTVHGAKGLQAPIVIIPEKMRTRTPIPALLWTQSPEGAPLFIVRPTQHQDLSFSQALKEDIDRQETFEEQRLLYVALTRAQDQLYFCGYGDTQEETSWYTQAQQADAMDIPWPPPIEDIWSGSDDARSPDMTSDLLHTLQTYQASSKRSQVDMLDPTEEEDIPAIQTDQMTRGIMIHQFFEILTTLPDSERHETLATLLSEIPTDRFSTEDQHKMISLLKSPQYAPLFCHLNGINEVDIYDPIQHQMLRLDRLIIEPHRVIILDYKTSESIPQSPGDLHPKIYTQLSRYYQCLRDLYPNRKIECYVVWTYGPSIQDLTPFMEQ